MKPYRLVVPRAIQGQIDDIVSYIAENQSLNRAIKIENSLLSAIEAIPDSPLSHPIETGIQVPDERVRRVIVGRTYRIIYEIDGDRVVILAVFHNSRNPDILKKLKR